jgi:hypothetical protein
LRTIYSNFHNRKRPNSSVADSKNILIKTILSKIYNKRPSSLEAIPENYNVITLPGVLESQPEGQYLLEPIPPDGDCFYSAIINGLNLTRMTPQKLRRELTKIVKDPEVLRRIRAPRFSTQSWAEEEEIQTVATMYKICIVIWDSIAEIWRIVYNKKPKNKQYGISGCKRVVYLYNHGIPVQSMATARSSGTHFDLLRPIN